MRFLFALGSTLLLHACWGSSGWPVFISLIFLLPLLLVEHFFCKSKTKKILVGFVAFLSFHLLAGFSLFNDVKLGTVALLLVLDAILFTIPWALYLFVKARLSLALSLLSLVAFWLSMEYITSHFWSLCPWFNLGYSLGGYPKIIQWYELTGVLGGTLWVLACNTLAFWSFIMFRTNRWRGFPGVLTGMIIVTIAPIVWSVNTRPDVHHDDTEALVIDVNKGPSMLMSVTFKELVEATLRQMSNRSKYIVWPESAFGARLDRSDREHPLVAIVRDRLLNAGTVLVGGATLREGREYFNSALIISKNTQRIYTKSILAPFAEYTPHWFFRRLSFFDREYELTKSSRDPDQIDSMAVAICYEELFGELVSRNCMRSNGGIIIVISNEEWTKGAAYGTLRMGTIRAIENRKYVLRSTIEGFSSIIGPDGTVRQNEDESNDSIKVIKGYVKPNSTVTFYMRFGDYIGVFALWLSACVASLCLFFKGHGIFLKVRTMMGR